MAAAVRESRRERRGLPEVAAKPDEEEPGIRLLQLCQQLERLVRAAVVDDDDLVRTAEPLERRGQLAVELPNVRGLVPHRHNDRNLWRHRKQLIIQ